MTGIRSAIIATLVIFQAASSWAITFAPAEKQDPFAGGAKCQTPVMMSWGEYVYEWSSRYDLIISPEDYPVWIWRCPTSGYVSFPRHFEFKSAEEKARIAAFLKSADSSKSVKAADGAITFDLISHLEALYAVRDIGLADRAWLMRYLAWYNKDGATAGEYRKKALALHKQILETTGAEPFDVAASLYSAGFYSRKFGERGDSSAYFNKLKALIAAEKDFKSWRFPPSFFLELTADAEAGKGDDAVRFAPQP
jgi:hypothetical protein